MNANQIAVLKAATLRKGDKVCILTYSYHCEQEDKTKSFYRVDGWTLSKEDVEKKMAAMLNDPSTLFRLKPVAEYDVTGGKRTFTNRDGAKWLKLRVNKAFDDYEDFKSQIFASKAPFPKCYKTEGGADVDLEKIETFMDLPSDTWFSYVIPRKRKVMKKLLVA